jgi:elongation factor Ts
MTITATDVNKLRQMTGAGMMDCKNALQETNGDIEQAIDYLRKKGQKVAAKRADRDANEGIVLSAVSADHSYAAVIMVNCETDFVGKTEEFRQFAKDILALGISHRPKTIDELKALKLGSNTVSEKLDEMLAKTGEKIQLAHYEPMEADLMLAYNHHGNRLATILGLNKKTAKNATEIGHELAMQVAAMNPIAVDKDDVSQKEIDREIEIGKEQARQEGKPEEMLEKIATGKLGKFFKDRTLLNQDFVRDTKKTVRQYIADNDKDLKVTGFRRLMLGE